ISDVGVSVIFSLAALETAALNVEINLAGIKDKEFVAKKRKTLQFLLREGKKIERNVKKKVEKLIKK
ncbi:MAG: cyclodeaminase/cyclohydrolase family protein, partial [Candidatus Omnitrophica bacterium]|nr:cyclodeaminase/cyclohydrolase family protein [Candidatus Omnitrophota bacterium]